MQSPFPGMDPFMERHWGDVHTSLTAYIKDALNESLPDGLVARSEESVRIDEPGHESHYARPDVNIVERQPFAPAAGGSATATVSEHEIFASLSPEEDRWIEIVEARDHSKVITAIEILSPANKWDAAGVRAYQKKVALFHAGRVNTVEIDLLRQGQHATAVPLNLLTPDAALPYHVCVWRPSEVRGRLEVYRFGLRDPLPVVAVPLRATDADVPLALQPLLDRCYRAGRYAATLDYRQPLMPPLAGIDQQWLDQRLAL